MARCVPILVVLLGLLATGHRSAVVVAQSTTTAGTLSESNRQAVLNAIATFEDVVQKAATQMTTQVNQQPSSPPCTDRRAACGSEAVNLTEYTANPRVAVPSDFDFVQTRASNRSNETTAKEGLCPAKGMQSTWSNSLVNNRGDLLFQYYATPSDNLAVYPPRKWNCSEAYVPTERPFYVAGVAGQRDVVVLLESAGVGTGATARLELAKAGVRRVLASLSVRDYVAVFTLAASARPLVSSKMQRATSATIALLQEAVEGVTVQTREPSVSLSVGVETALAALAAGTASTSTSDCNQEAIFFVSGADSSRVPANLILQRDTSAAMMVVAVHVAEGATQSTIPLSLRRLACAGAGLALSLPPGSAGPAAVVRKINNLYATLLAPAESTSSSSSTIRWSEPYEDAFGQGNITSGAAVVRTGTTFRGLIVADVQLAALQVNGQVTRAQLEAVLLAEQTCLRLNRRGTNRARLEALQGTQCDGLELSSEPGELTDRKLKGLYVVLGLLGVAIALSVPFCLGVFFRFRARDFGVRIALMCCFGVALLCYMLGTGFFWANVYDDVVEQNNFDRVRFVVTAEASNAYRCCEEFNCSTTCTGGEAPAGAPSCNALLASKQESLACGGGYFCCSKHCRTDDRDKCSCQSSVEDLRCSVRCGTCHNPVSYVAYEYEGVSYESTITAECGLDDFACLARVQWPLGEAQDGWVDPSFPLDIRSERPGPEDSEVSKAAGWFFTGLAVNVCLCAAVVVLRLCCHEN